MMSGFAHVGVSTHDMTATLNFYCNILKCKLLADETVEISDGGTIRQTSIGVGNDQYLVFMEANGVKTISESYDTSINSALGLPAGMYHYSFNIRTLEELEELGKHLAESDVDVSEITNLDYIKSIFFQDPNGLQLEVSVKQRDFNNKDIGKITKANIAS
tara:strand:- start:6851 stop:7330 length:480 start_codon:yes stop_codon:yes gene_type:complete